MMISVLMFIFFMMVDSLNLFLGVFNFLMMFIIFVLMFYLWGVDGFKGDLYGMLGLDYISFFLVLLLLWLISLILILFWGDLLNILFLILLLSIFIMFISLDMLYLFIYFEFSMLPIFFMIMFFGISKERYFATMYMFIYTMMSSLPTLIIFLKVSDWFGVICIDYISYNFLAFDSMVLLLVIIMFLVKVPMFMVHIWLPKAHVEAPVYGSMILASVMLKMGGYGIVRCMDLMMFNYLINDFFFCLCLSGSFMISYICLFQVDLKVLVAYSSIIHMGLMLMGFFSGTEFGYVGGFIMMLSHGICSSGMFYLVNEIYLISGSRLLMLNKGLMGVVPALMWMWLIMLINNLGAPPCFGILGELMLLSGCMNYFFFIFIFFIFTIFFVSCFVMNMYSLLMSGCTISFIGMNLLGYYGAIIHLIPMNFFIVFMIWF